MASICLVSIGRAAAIGVEPFSRFDLGASGVLGRGAIHGLEFSQDGIKLTWTVPGRLNTVTVQHIQWDPSWDIDEDESYTWAGGDWSQAANWTVTIDGTPGSR